MIVLQDFYHRRYCLGALRVRVVAGFGFDSLDNLICIIHMAISMNWGSLFWGCHMRDPILLGPNLVPLTLGNSQMIYHSCYQHDVTQAPRGACRDYQGPSQRQQKQDEQSSPGATWRSSIPGPLCPKVGSVGL